LADERVVEFQERAAAMVGVEPEYPMISGLDIAEKGR
jgi:hypothetical protein